MNRDSITDDLYLANAARTVAGIREELKLDNDLALRGNCYPDLTEDEEISIPVYLSALDRKPFTKRHRREFLNLITGKYQHYWTDEDEREDADNEAADRWLHKMIYRGL